MGDPSAKPEKPRRRWIRGSVFWLCIVLAGLIAGSWVLSYWRADTFLYMGSSRDLMVGNDEGSCKIWIMAGRPPNTPPPPPLRRGAQWDSQPRRAALRQALRNLWQFRCETDRRYGVFTDIFFPDWVPLLTFLVVAWWASRPWRRARRETRRGFEVVT